MYSIENKNGERRSVIVERADNGDVVIRHAPRAADGRKAHLIVLAPDDADRLALWLIIAADRHRASVERSARDGLASTSPGLRSPAPTKVG